MYKNETMPANSVEPPFIHLHNLQLVCLRFFSSVPLCYGPCLNMNCVAVLEVSALLGILVVVK